METRYVLIEDYNMKCRFYASCEKSKLTNDKVHLEKVLVNNTEHLIKTTYCFCTEDVNEKGEVIHWFNKDDFKKYAKKPEFINKLKESDPRLKELPTSNFNHQSHSAIDRIIQSYKTTNNAPVEKWGRHYNKEAKKKINYGPKYYSKKKECKSFYCTFDASAIKRLPVLVKDNSGNLVPKVDDDGNVVYRKNVLGLNLPKIGLVELRGWNKDIRFDASCQMDFIEWCELHKRKTMYATVSIDTCGQYWVSIPLKRVYKPKKEYEVKTQHEGIDVGEVTLAALSDGTKYKNLRQYNPKVSQIEKEIRYYQRQLAGMWGPSNPAFREECKKISIENKAIKKKNKKLPEDQQLKTKWLEPSNNYKRLQSKINKKYEKLKNIREDYYHKVSAEITAKADVIITEDISVTDMYWPKKKKLKEKDPDKLTPFEVDLLKNKTNKQIHRHNKDLADVALYDFLSKVWYKSDWYGDYTKLDKYQRSTGVCPVCGHVGEKLDTSIRKWTCTKCGAQHDRDIAAAQVINQLGYEKYLAELELEKQNQTA